MQRFFASVHILIFITGAAFASEIRHKEYPCTYEFAKGAAEPAFVVCDNCPHRKAPASKPKTTPAIIVLKVSEPAPVNPDPLSAATKQEESGSNPEPFKDASLAV